jgi:hypothetical protein
MRAPHRRPRPGHRLGVGGLVVTAVLLASACAGPRQEKTSGATAVPSPLPSATAPAPTATPHGGLPDPRAVDRRDATEVSRAAVRVMWTVDATIDRSQVDAYLRAKPYLSPEYAEAVTTEPAGAVPSAWRDHRAYARVRLTAQAPEDGVGTDTDSTAHRQWGITITPTGRDGWTGPSIHATAFVTLTRGYDGGWQVSQVTTA